GSTPADPCCGMDCRLSPPPCVAPSGPCSSADAAFTDGTPCGPGAPPCVAQVCRSGVCVTQIGSGGCLIGATCFLPGALDPVDACQRCDPAQRTDSWSRNVDPDAAGLRCEVLRVTRAFTANACRPGLIARVERRLMRVQQLVGQLGTASTAGVGRVNGRLSRAILRLVRAEHAGNRHRCDMGTFPQELETFVRQFAAYRQSVGR